MRGNHAPALAHYRKFHLLQQEVFGEKNMTAIRSLQAGFNAQQAEQEKELYRLKSERLELEMTQSAKELRSMSLNLVQKNESIDRVRKEAMSLLKSSTGKSKSSVTKLLQTVESQLDARADWKTFEAQFSDVYQDFTRTLSEKFPSITPTELKICALLKLGLTNKDISKLLFTTDRNIEAHRYRLRKKFRLAAADNLISFLAAL